MYKYTLLLNKNSLSAQLGLLYFNVLYSTQLRFKNSVYKMNTKINIH